MFCSFYFLFSNLSLSCTFPSSPGIIYFEWTFLIEKNVVPLTRKWIFFQQKAHVLQLIYLDGEGNAFPTGFSSLSHHIISCLFHTPTIFSHIHTPTRSFCVIFSVWSSLFCSFFVCSSLLLSQFSLSLFILHLFFSLSFSLYKRHLIYVGT